MILRDLIAKYLSGLVYQAKHNTLGTYWNSYQEADDFMESFNLSELGEWEGVYRDNKFYLKQPNGKFIDMNSLTEFK